MDSDGQRDKGYCHVIFEDPPCKAGEALQAALALDGSTIKTDFSFAFQKAVKQAVTSRPARQKLGHSTSAPEPLRS